MENENLVRKQQKIFAGNTTVADEQIAVFGSKAETGTMAFSKDPDVIQNENWENGWENATVVQNSPFQEDFNAVEFSNTYNIAYLLQKGIPEYSSSTTYYKGSICLVIDNNGKPTLYYSKTDSNTGNNPTTDTTNWSIFNSGSSHYVGQLVPALLPITDATVHLTDGGTITQDGIYTSFVANLKSLVSEFPHLFCTNEEFETILSEYGRCNKFVINDEAGTVRLPFITDYIKGVNNLNELGTVLKAGVPNITGEFYSGAGVYNPNGAFSHPKTNTGRSVTNVGDAPDGCAFDASKSNPIYGQSDTVTPASATAAYYIVLATNTNITNIEVDINEVVTDLNNKVSLDGSDANFSNLSQTAKSNILNFAMPIPKSTDGVGQVVQIRQVGGTLVAPAGGTWFYFYINLNAEHDVYFDSTNTDTNPNNPSSGICAGGATLTTGTPLPAFYCGFFIRIA